MKITPQVPNYQTTNTQPKANTKKDSPTNRQQQQVDQYIPSKEEKAVTYKKPKTKVDTATIDKLKIESERAHDQLRNLVKQLLKRQGVTFSDVIKNGGSQFKVDDQARLEAQAAIDEGGSSSPEVVSDRIVDFAKAISGGDQGKFDLLKGAIIDGFDAAKKALGGSLPDISQKTYDLVMEKLENWKNEA